MRTIYFAHLSHSMVIRLANPKSRRTPTNIIFIPRMDKPALFQMIKFDKLKSIPPYYDYTDYELKKIINIAKKIAKNLEKGKIEFECLGDINLGLHTTRRLKAQDFSILSLITTGLVINCSSPILESLPYYQQLSQLYFEYLRTKKIKRIISNLKKKRKLKVHTLLNQK